jgi:hypothetical protein
MPYQLLLLGSIKYNGRKITFIGFDTIGEGEIMSCFIFGNRQRPKESDSNPKEKQCPGRDLKKALPKHLPLAFICSVRRNRSVSRAI